MPINDEHPTGGIISFNPSLSDEQIADLTARFREQIKRRPAPIELGPSAVTLRRRSPEERRAYLLEHRDEAIANGIPEELVDWMIQDAESEQP